MFLVICLVLLIRLALWEDKSLAYLALLLIALSVLQTFAIQEGLYFEEVSDTPYIIEVKQTSWKVDGNQLKFQGAIKDSQTTQKVMVHYTIKTESEKEQLFRPYNRVVSTGVFRSPSQATNSKLFDYKLYLERQNIKQVLYADLLLEMDSLPAFHERTYFLDSLRMRALAYSDMVFSSVTSLYVRALLFADRSALSEEVIQSFRNLGLMHLLSISGLHISLLLGGLNKAVLKIRVTRESSLTLQLVFLLVYAVFTGLGVSVYRASVQHGVKNLYDLRKQSIHTLDCWSVALISLLLINPAVILTVGFQLSFLMSFLIILLSGQPFFRSLSLFTQYAVLNGILFIASIPVLSYHFFEFSLGALLFNSIYIPFISLLLLPGLILLFALSPLLRGTAVFYMLDQLLSDVITLMESLTYGIEEAASLVFVSGRLPVAVMVLWALTGILLLLMMEKRMSWLSACLFVIVFISLAASNRLTPFGEIIMIDVGQGDAILIKEPFNRDVTLIDTGGAVNWREYEEWEVKQSQFALGSHVLVPLMKSMGIDRIDTVLITHLHYDHYGELASMAEHIPVSSIAGTTETLTDSSFHEQLNRMNMERTSFNIIDQSATLSFSDRLTVLKDSLKDKENINNQSVVLIGKYGKLVWMFTGDIEFEREEQLLRDYPGLEADVLKVAHHGSSSSTTEKFLEQIGPEYALISVGETNRFNHPHDEVLSRLKENTSETYRTDLHGSIHYRFSDYRLLDNWVSKYGQNFWTNSSQGDYE